MAIINTAETLAAKYPNAFGGNSVEKAEAVLGYLGLGTMQPAKGVRGDIQIEGEEVFKALTELADSEAFQAFNISLAIARAEDIDGSASVGLIVNKIDKAIGKLRNPDISKIIKANLKEMREDERNPEFKVTIFE